MKIWMTVLILSLLDSICSVRATKKEQNGKKHRPTKFYIENWTQYKLPMPIGADSMREILEKVALYRTLQYCPFDDINVCLKKGVTPVVKAIINDIVTGEDMSERSSKNSAIKRYKMAKIFQ